MTIKGVLRIGLIQLRVLDLKQTLEHYENILGLNYVCTTDDGRVCLKGFDEFDHHSVVLRESSEAGFDFAAFKVNSDENLTKLEQDIIAFGYKVDHVPPNSDQPGYGRRIGFTLPTGHRLELYHEVELAAQKPPLRNPDIWIEQPRGMKCQRLDHMLLFGPGIKEVERFFTEVLGLFAPEICNTPEGERLATWLTASNKPHDIAFVEYNVPNKIHHVGFFLQDWNDIGNAADIMAINNVKRDVGPTRHAITRGQTIYFFDPSGNRIETYAGGYTAYEDHPQRIWDSDELGKGLFYYEREMFPSFLSVIT